MSTGHALYYPNIHLDNLTWVKHALLFWDKISRIVPPSFEPEDSEEIVILKGETDFLADYKVDNSVVNETFGEFG